MTRFHPGPYVENLPGRTGAQRDVRTTTSARLAQTNLDAELQQGRAVSVRVTRGALPWIPDLSEHSDSVDVAAALLGAELPGIPARMMRNFGVAGMRTWAERLRDTRTRKGWTAMFASEDRLRPALLQLAGFLSGNEWSGPGGLRPLYAQFLRDASERGRPVGFRQAAAQYDELGKAWTGLATLVDPACPLDARSDHFAALADQLDRLAQAEQTAAESLRAALG